MTAEFILSQEENGYMSVLKISALLRVIGNGTPAYRQKAIDLVKSAGYANCLPLLEESVRNDSDADLRNGAMDALVEFGETAVPGLVQMLSDENEEVRNFSTVMLGAIGSINAVEPLISVLCDPDPNVRHGAAEALGKIGDLRAIEPLKLLQRGDSWDRFYASSALVMIGDAA